MITLSRNIFILLWTFMIIMLLNIINNKIVFSYFIRNQQQQQHRQSHYKSISFSIFNPFSTSTSTSSTAKQMFFSSLWRQIKQSNEKGRNSLIDADTPTYTAKKGNRYQEKVAVWTKETIADIVKESFALFNPPIRQFLRIKNEISKTSTLFNEITSTASVSISSKLSIVDTIRILQLNMLADGLSGLRDDLGAFSRISEVDMIWDNRKLALLKEVLQYNPDIITLQECDHFYDWFLPILTEQGYEGIFAPKPASACLEVSDNSDGCAIFVRRSKFQVKSVETLTYSLSKYDVSDDVIPGNYQPPPPGTSKEDLLSRPQNQVGLIVVCQMRNPNSNPDSSPNPDYQISTPSIIDLPEIIISTTHLKAAKSAKGERFRTREICQLLSNIDRLSMALAKQDRLHREPIVILTGDLNASPCVTKKKDENDYYPYAYEALKSHSLGLRSVLNDDEVEPHQIGELAVAMLTCSSTSGLHNNLPPIDSTIRYNENTNFANEFSRDTNIGKSKSILMVGKSVSRVGSVVGSLVNDRIVSANIDAVADVLNDWDDIDLKAVDGGLESVTKEKSKKPTTVRNTSDLDKLTKKKIGKVSVSTTGQSVTQSESDTTHRDSSREMQVDQGIWTTWKVRRKKGVEEASRMCIDYILYTPPIIPSDNKGSSSTANDRALTITPSTASISTSTTTTTTAPTAKRYRPVGIRSKAILDLLSANVVGPALLPSSIYPSDHLAIAADLEIVIYDKDL